MDVDILSNPEFTYSIKPTPVTLFRFSAITFNAHLIHYDHVYATEVEKQKGTKVYIGIKHNTLLYRLFDTWSTVFDIYGQSARSSLGYKRL